MAQAAFQPQKPTLIDIPVSNNGGRVRLRAPGNPGLHVNHTCGPISCAHLRSVHFIQRITLASPESIAPSLQCRFVLYKKGLKDKVDIVSPKVYGGMKSDEYVALNPQGLIPMLVLPDGKSLWESDVSVSPPCASQCTIALPACVAPAAKPASLMIHAMPARRSLPLTCVTSIKMRAPLSSCLHQRIAQTTSLQEGFMIST